MRAHRAQGRGPTATRPHSPPAGVRPFTAVWLNGTSQRGHVCTSQAQDLVLGGRGCLQGEEQEQDMVAHGARAARGRGGLHRGSSSGSRQLCAREGRLVTDGRWVRRLSAIQSQRPWTRRVEQKPRSGPGGGEDGLDRRALSQQTSLDSDGRCPDPRPRWGRACIREEFGFLLLLLPVAMKPISIYYDRGGCPL